MNSSRPIVATTSLSILLHSAALAGFSLVTGNVFMPAEGVGEGINIHLISSIMVSEQQESSEPGRYPTAPAVQQSSRLDSSQKAEPYQVVSTSGSIENVQSEALIDKEYFDEKRLDNVLPVQPQTGEQDQPMLKVEESIAHNLQSTNASGKKHSILELLHSSISNNKEYPYLARRQRREGVATVSFVLHPDGRIEDTQLVDSSRAMALDRAAMSAVKKIEPFIAAQDYLEQSEKFQIDIEFELL